MAALIIASILFGLTAIVNRAQGGSSNEAFYGLSKEINFETKRVLDYGTYYAQDTNALMQSFLVKYADYIAQEKVLFVFGNRNQLSGLYFTRGLIGSTGISTGGQPSMIMIQETTGSFANVTATINGVDAEINGITYHFDLLDGQNFFFVIIKENEQEAFVATNEAGR